VDRVVYFYGMIMKNLNKYILCASLFIGISILLLLSKNPDTEKPHDVPDKNLPKNITLETNEPDLCIELVHINAGSFVMGEDWGIIARAFAKFSASWMVGKAPDNEPARKVTITKGFYIGIYKITNEQYCKFLNSIDEPNKYIELNDFANIEIKNNVYFPKEGCEKGPVNVVPWIGAMEFCKWLSDKSNRIVRLPTEAEWEFTACGHENRKFPWGNEDNKNRIYPCVNGDINNNKTQTSYTPQNSIEEFKEYTRKPVDANTYNMTPDGVIGMGGVGEWCSDFYGVYYLKDDLIDPKGPTEAMLADESLNPFYPDKFYVLRGAIFTKYRNFGDYVGTGGDYAFRILVEEN
jgi:formylglycine-generating enzyme required for sulfatase activity